MFALGLLHMQMTSYLLVLTVFVWMLLNVCFILISFRLGGEANWIMKISLLATFPTSLAGLQANHTLLKKLFSALVKLFSPRNILATVRHTLFASRGFFFAYFFYIEGDVQESVKDSAINLLVF